MEQTIGSWETRRHRVGLTLVLLMAAFLRFGGITRVGIRFDDESWYASDARLWHRCARVLTDGEAIRAVWHHDKQAFQRRMNEIGVDFKGRYFKPSQGYTFLGALMMFVVGDKPAALLVTNALCGTLSVAVLYLLGTAVFDRRVAILGAGLLAVSPYHLIYCRSALAETSAGFFILLGTLAWAYGHSGRWTSRRAYLLSGIALGYAITCHFRAALVPPTFFMVDMWLRIRGHTPIPNKSEESHRLEQGSIDHGTGVVPSIRKELVIDRSGQRQNTLPPLRAGLWLFVGVLLPTALLEFIFRAARMAAVITDSYLPVKTFLEAHWFHARKLAQAVHTGWNGKILPTYAAYFVHWQGIAALVIAVFGLALLVRTRGSAKGFGLLAGVLLLAMSFQQFLVARVLSLVIPFLCLGLAVGIWWIMAKLGRGNRRIEIVVALILFPLILGPSAVGIGKVRASHSQLAQSCTWVAQRGGTVVVPDRCKYWLYLERSGQKVIAGEQLWPEKPPEQTLEELRSAGVRWIILDPQYWHYGPGDPVFQWWHAMRKELSQHAVLAAEFPHLRSSRWEFLVEGPGLTRLPEMARYDGGPLRVYDLQATRKTEHTRAAVAAVRDRGSHSQR